MPHDPANPPAQDFTSLAWAMWTFYERTGATQLEDAQVAARLALHVRVVDGVTYYRPLATAADFITDPGQVTDRQRNDISEKFVDPLAVAKAWNAVQANLDSQIPAPVSGEPAEGAYDSTVKWEPWS